MLLDLYRHYLVDPAPPTPSTGQARTDRIAQRVLRTIRRVPAIACELLAELEVGVRTRRQLPLELEGAGLSAWSPMIFRPVPLTTFRARTPKLETPALASIETRTIHIRRDLVLGRRNMRTLLRLGEL